MRNNPLPRYRLAFALISLIALSPAFGPVRPGLAAGARIALDALPFTPQLATWQVAAADGGVR